MSNTEDPIISYFRVQDPPLGRIAEHIGPLHLQQEQAKPFVALAKAIVFQQLAGPAARATFNRLQRLCDNELTPQQLMARTDAELRDCGLSRQKVRYLRSLTENVQNGYIDNAHLKHMSDDAVRQQLTQIKGIGPWTANMFLMFHLTREDVFAPRDLGIHRAMCQLYNMTYPQSHKSLCTIAERWSPYRTYACLYLWRWQDTAEAGW